VLHSKGNKNLSMAIKYVCDVADNSEEASAVGSMDTKETGEVNAMCELCLNREQNGSVWCYEVVLFLLYRAESKLLTK